MELKYLIYDFKFFEPDIPLSKFNLAKREELLKACHYTNLQPMWHLENLSRGNN